MSGALEQRVLETLEQLKRASPAALNGPKKDLAALLGISESTLNVRIAHLIELGKITRIPAAGPVCSTLVIPGCRPGPVAVTATLEETVELGHSVTHSVTKNSCDRSDRNRGTEGPIGRSGHILGHTAPEPSIHPCTPVKGKTQYRNQVSDSLRSSASAARSAAPENSPEADASIKVKIRGFPEAVKPWDISILAQQGKLTQDMMDGLDRIKRSRYKAWYQAAVEGIVQRLRGQYRARWASSMKAPQHAFKEASGTKGQYWNRAAQHILELRVSVDQFLEVAWASKHFNARVPSLSYLAGPMLFQHVQNGYTANPDGMTSLGVSNAELDEILERSRHAGLLPRD